MVVTLRDWIDLKFRLEIIAVCWSVFIDLILNLLFFYTVSNVQAQPLGCPLEQATGVRNRVTGRTQRLRFLIWYQKCKKFSWWPISKFLKCCLPCLWGQGVPRRSCRSCRIRACQRLSSFWSWCSRPKCTTWSTLTKDVTGYGQRLI